MLTKREKDIITAIDIGSSQVKIAIAEAIPGGNIELLGVGVAKNHGGIREGIVVDIDKTISAIGIALQEAIKTTGKTTNELRIKKAAIGITGKDLRDFNSSGVMPLKAGVTTSSQREVTNVDIAKVIDVASSVTIPPDKILLLTDPQELHLDGIQRDQPLGLIGTKLEAKVHMVTGVKSQIDNIVKCVRRCGIEVELMVLNPLASGQAVLTEAEKSQGVLCIDIGAEVTDVAVFYGGNLIHTSAIPVGGNYINKDIVAILHTPIEATEEIKIKHGCALESMITKEQEINEEIQVPNLDGVGSRTISKQALANIIETRVKEIYKLALDNVEAAGMEDKIKAGGIVITGGASKMPYMQELATKFFPVFIAKTATPRYTQYSHKEKKDLIEKVISNPEMSTVIGILLDLSNARTHGFKGVELSTSPKGLLAKIKSIFS